MAFGIATSSGPEADRSPPVCRRRVVVIRCAREGGASTPSWGIAIPGT